MSNKGSGGKSARQKQRRRAKKALRIQCEERAVSKQSKKLLEFSAEGKEIVLGMTSGRGSNKNRLDLQQEIIARDAARMDDIIVEAIIRGDSKVQIQDMYRTNVVHEFDLSAATTDTAILAKMAERGYECIEGGWTKGDAISDVCFHVWNTNGDTCTKCGDKDWMEGGSHAEVGITIDGVTTDGNGTCE